MITNFLSFENIPCGSCAKTIAKAIQSLSGVHACEVDANNNRAMIQFIPERIQIQSIQNALGKIGYPTELLDKNDELISSSKQSQI